MRVGDINKQGAGEKQRALGDAAFSESNPRIVLIEDGVDVSEAEEDRKRRNRVSSKFVLLKL